MRMLALPCLRLIEFVRLDSRLIHRDVILTNNRTDAKQAHFHPRRFALIPIESNLCSSVHFPTPKLGLNAGFNCPT